MSRGTEYFSKKMFKITKAIIDKNWPYLTKKSIYRNLLSETEESVVRPKGRAECIVEDGNQTENYCSKMQNYCRNVND